MVELVIKIPEQEYDECKNRFNMIYQEGYLNYSLNTALVMHIANGTVLPKGHGRLIDADKLVYDCSLGGGGCDHICRCDGCSYNIIREHTINDAQTIIKADKENKQ